MKQEKILSISFRLPRRYAAFRSKIMKIKYFKDTDTALVEFSDHQVAQTKEINENIYVDLDVDDNLVNMTIEHASSQANIAEVAYQQIENKSG
jgi:uncharacterized protein YuzE